MTTPYERLLAEELPTGQFGGPRPDTHPQGELPRTTSPIEAATHRAELEQALTPRRHLTPVADAPDQAA
ncbi:hypothetical protein [Streptomyces phytophilus]|uniref:hypothetical protein n=1 Tax=Streptomyces phytophilus TaxID=722715 RepID=UPI0015F0808B|nr:hypothetical protein [Streptomyces phytophilus]